MNFSVPVYHWVKIKENKKGGKYLDLARESKKLVELEIRGKSEILQTTTLLRLTKILTRVLET